jgi:hypothetical protein
MARFAGSQFRPAMQQAVAIDKYSHQRHDTILSIAKKLSNRKCD